MTAINIRSEGVEYLFWNEMLIGARVSGIPKADFDDLLRVIHDTPSFHPVTTSVRCCLEDGGIADGLSRVAITRDLGGVA